MLLFFEQKWILILGPAILAGALVLSVVNKKSPSESVIEYTLKSEPIDLTASMNEAGHGHEEAYLKPSGEFGTFEAPEDFWAESIHPEIINAPPEVLHHARFSFRDIPDYQCPSSPDKSVGVKEPIWWFLADNLNTAFAFPKPYALFFPRGAALEFSPRFFNATPKSYKDVSIRITLRGKNNGHPDNKHIPVRYYRVMSEKCVNEAMFGVPPRTSNFVRRIQGGPLIMPEGGTVALLVPHFHTWQGGKSQSVFVNGKEVWKFYGMDNEVSAATITAVPHYRPDQSNPKTFRLEKGDKIDSVAVYDNPGDTEQAGLMSVFVFFLAPDSFHPVRDRGRL